MNQPTSVQSLRTAAAAPREAALPDIVPSFGSSQSFELMVRQSKLLMATTLVPAAYREFTEKKKGGSVEYIKNENALANCCVALNMATRMGADPLMVMQNLYIVEGRPSWSSQWIIASINSCGRFSPLRFDLKDLGKKTVEYSVTEWGKGPNGNEKQTKTIKAEINDKSCTAWVIEKETGERLTGPTVSIEMAVREGWYGKNGSKWQTMDEVMLRYRAASFFGKLYAPELLMGLQSAEEMHDAIDATPQPDGSYAVDVNALRQAAASAGETIEAQPVKVEEPEPQEAVYPEPVVESEPAAKPAESIDTTTGEITNAKPAGPTFEDAAAAVKASDFDLARDIARTLSEGERKAIDASIENAQPKAKPERQRRQRDILNVD